MENLPILNSAPPRSATANNTASAATDAAPRDSQDSGSFDAALQRELAREAPATSSQATADKDSDHAAEVETLLSDAGQITTDTDNLVATLLAAPVAIAPQPEPPQTPMTTVSGIGTGKAATRAWPTQAQEPAALPAAANEQEVLSTGQGANLVAANDRQTVMAGHKAATGPQPLTAGHKAATDPQPLTAVHKAATDPQPLAAGHKAATDPQALAAGPEANFAARGKTLMAFAAAHEAPAPGNAGANAIAGAAEIMKFQIADITPPIQTHAPAAMSGPAVPQPVSMAPATGQELNLAPQVGAPGWDGALAQKVTWLLGGRQQVAELHLNPPHLGPLEVRLSMASDQNAVANAQFNSPHAAVREAIEAAMPRLREILAESGVTLGNTTVGNDSFRQQQSFTPGDGTAAPWRGEEGAAGVLSGAGTPSPIMRSVRNGMVDIFA